MCYFLLDLQVFLQQWFLNSQLLWNYISKLPGVRKWDSYVLALALATLNFWGLCLPYDVRSMPVKPICVLCLTKFCVNAMILRYNQTPFLRIVSAISYWQVLFVSGISQFLPNFIYCFTLAHFFRLGGFYCSFFLSNLLWLYCLNNHEYLQLFSFIRKLCMMWWGVGKGVISILDEPLLRNVKIC